MRIFLLVGALALGACSAAQIQQAAQVAQTFQPVASAVACEAQAIANQSGNSTASFVAGTFCNDLAAGSALPNAVAVLAGQTVTLPTSTGTVTLPVPAAAPAAKTAAAS